MSTTTATEATEGEPFREGVEPIVPAYWLRSSPVHIAFYCPWCRTPHFHGAGGGEGGRGSHCSRPTSPLFGHGYRLLYVGEVASARALPRLSKHEIIGFSNQLNDAGARTGRWMLGRYHDDDDEET
jgi:hypothetical protein